MTAEHDDKLELALAGMTTWSGPTPRLWERALKAANKAKTSARSPWAWLSRGRRLSGPLAACIIIACVGSVIYISMSSVTRDYGKFNHSVAKQFVVSSQEGPSYDASLPSAGIPAIDIATISELESLAYISGGESSVDAGSETGIFRGRVGAGRSIVSTTPVPLDKPQASGEVRLNLEPNRQIIRKATVELLTGDVRAAFSKVSMTLNEALGEYVQESSLTGSGEHTQAEITIRVAADRLSEVMNALRDLGQVTREQITGQDVTSQAVDLEARLRNEQCVEAELLQLLEKRQDAPLKEILELRANLGVVRGVIEQLTAQRQKLGQLVSLSTVLIIIRSDRQPRPTEFSILTYFGDNFREAWGKGLVFLADTAGGLLSILIGGLIWWIVLAIILVAIWRHRRRSAAEIGR